MAAAAFAPPKFQVSEEYSSSSWRDYKQDITNYFVAAGLEQASEERKVAILLYGMGTRYRSIFTTLPFETEAKKKEFDTVLKLFDEHFEPKKVTKLYMTRFDSCRQNECESIAEYISRLKDIAVHCDFGDTLANQLCKQISVGVKYKDLRDKLWAEDLTLAQIQNKCFLYEQRIESKAVLEPNDVKPVNYAGRGRGYSDKSSYSRGPSRGSFRGQSQQPRPYQPAGRGAQFYRSQQQSYTSRNTCGNCGKSHPPRRCPAYRRTCSNCQKLGHFAECCRSRNVQAVSVQDDYYTDYSSENSRKFDD